jgi:hypothetical protein
MAALLLFADDVAGCYKKVTWSHLQTYKKPKSSQVTGLK